MEKIRRLFFKFSLSKEGLYEDIYKKGVICEGAHIKKLDNG